MLFLVENGHTTAEIWEKLERSLKEGNSSTWTIFTMFGSEMQGIPERRAKHVDVFRKLIVQKIVYFGKKFSQENKY